MNTAPESKVKLMYHRANGRIMCGNIRSYFSCCDTYLSTWRWPHCSLVRCSFWLYKLSLAFVYFYVKIYIKFEYNEILWNKIFFVRAEEMDDFANVIAIEGFGNGVTQVVLHPRFDLRYQLRIDVGCPERQATVNLQHLFIYRNSCFLHILFSALRSGVISFLTFSGVLKLLLNQRARGTFAAYQREPSRNSDCVLHSFINSKVSILIKSSYR